MLDSISMLGYIGNHQYIGSTQERTMIPTSHFLSVIQAERAEQMRRAQLLLIARSTAEARPGVAARLLAAWRTRRGHDAASAGCPSPAATCAPVCC
jgi:hypothetical protein